MNQKRQGTIEELDAELARIRRGKGTGGSLDARDAMMQSGAPSKPRMFDVGENVEGAKMMGGAALSLLNPLDFRKQKSVGRLVSETGKAMFSKSTYTEALPALAKELAEFQMRSQYGMPLTDEDEKFGERYPILKAVGDDYIDKYGSIQKIADTLENNPAEIVADLSMVGKIGKGGKFVRIAKSGLQTPVTSVGKRVPGAKKAVDVVTKTAKAIDPDALPIKVAAAATKPVKTVTKAVGRHKGTGVTLREWLAAKGRMQRVKNMQGRGPKTEKTMGQKLRGAGATGGVSEVVVQSLDRLVGLSIPPGAVGLGAAGLRLGVPAVTRRVLEWASKPPGRNWLSKNAKARKVMDKLKADAAKAGYLTEKHAGEIGFTARQTRRAGDMAKRHGREREELEELRKSLGGKKE